MNSPTANASPKFKNLNSKSIHSPIEIKEKMRKNYKDKVKNCRELLMNRFRGTIIQTDLRNTLDEIYKSMFNFSDEERADDEELEILNKIRGELIDEELEWLVTEYEKSQGDIDWATEEESSNVICPICQKNNCKLLSNLLTCPKCNYNIKTNLSIKEIKQYIFGLVEKHSSACDNDCQFTVVSEQNESHVYLICDHCMEMQIVV